MQRRSLLDYIDDTSRSDAASPATDTAARLEQRLAELERRLAATRCEAPAIPEPEPAQTFAARIESILHRQAEPVTRPPDMQRAAPPTPPAPQPAPQPLALAEHRRMAEIAAPPMERSAEFAKFVEAVHLIGQAANRFLGEPQARIQKQDEAVTALATTLKYTTAAFAAMTAELVAAAADIRRAAETPRRLAEPEQAAPRRASRADHELEQVMDELDGLRDRIGAMMRRKSRWND